MAVQPYLFFNGACDEALAFYKEALGAQVVRVMRFRDAPDPALVRPGMEDRIMHAHMQIGDAVVLASDGGGDGAPGFNGFGLTLEVADEAEAERRFEALAACGTVRMPLDRTFFSRRFGMVADRFGVLWMVMVRA
jgi:PhnB protein